MARDDSISRRTVMKLAGATTATAVIAGCSGGDGEDGDDGSDGSDGDDGDDGGDQLELEPGDEVVFSGETTAWIGKEPSDIEGVENPTIVVEEGETYTIGWDEGDGAGHNIEIRNGDGDVVDDYATEIVSEPDEDQFIEFEATSEMAVYRCNPHAQMEGDIVVE